MNNDTEFNPDWVSPPGDSIKEVLEFIGVTTLDLAVAMNTDLRVVHRLLEGEELLTSTLAEKLSIAIDVLGKREGKLLTLGSTTPSFWLRREQQYRDGLERLLAQAAIDINKRLQ